jgi:hypothetical protein
LIARSNIGTLGFDSLVNDTVRMPLRQGAQGLLKHGSAIYRWKNVSDSETYITQPYNDKISVLLQGEDLGSDSFARWPMITFSDDEWSPAAIAIRGATEGQTFDIETVYCVEYIPDTEGAASSMAKQPPKASPKSVDAASEHARETPLAGLSSVFQTAVKIASVAVPAML